MWHQRHWLVAGCSCAQTKCSRVWAWRRELSRWQAWCKRIWLGESSSHLRWTWLPKTNGITGWSNASHWILWLIFLAGAMAFIQYFKKVPIRALLRYLPGRLTGAIDGIHHKIKIDLTWLMWITVMAFLQDVQKTPLSELVRRSSRMVNWRHKCLNNLTWLGYLLPTSHVGAKALLCWA